MASSQQCPLDAELDTLARNCKLPLHVGTARVQRQNWGAAGDPWFKLHEQLSRGKPKLNEVDFAARFLVPASGGMLILLEGRDGVGLQRMDGEGLTVQGTSADGNYELSCPQFFVKRSGPDGNGSTWAVAMPVNEPAVLSYSNQPITGVSAQINNFDFDAGNLARDETKPYERDVLRVQASGRNIDFVRRPCYESVKMLLDTGALYCSALLDFSFDAWENATESELAAFAYSVAALCSVVARQQTGLPILTFLGSDGRPIKRLISNPIESHHRRGYIVEDLQRSLPKVFSQCFEPLNQLAGSHWGTVPTYSATIEDPPYLEQKCASLMSGLELLLRNSCLDAGVCSAKVLEGKSLADLIAIAKAKLRWDIPKHYTTGDKTRLLRNAVSHGGPLPDAPVATRRLLDKWSLFFMRRLLIRLGFDGEVVSPHQGLMMRSVVSDFSEESNSFGLCD